MDTPVLPDTFERESGVEKVIGKQKHCGKNDRVFLRCHREKKEDEYQRDLAKTDGYFLAIQKRGPRNEEKQEAAVAEFWSHLLVSESPGSVPVLARYDGQRPLAPWLIRVFQNWHLSKLRQSSGVTALPDDEIALPMDAPKADGSGRWHETFVAAAREWLGAIDDDERLLLGLRWRYRLSQREAAKLFSLNEGTLTRRTDKLRDRALEHIGGKLVADGWAGDDLEGFVLTELGSLLTDDPRLSADQLGRLLAAKGKALPLES